MKATAIATLLASQQPLDTVRVNGWVRTRRDSGTFSFIEVNDGSCLANIQVIAEADLANFDQVRHLTTGSALRVAGALIPSPGKGQRWELKAKAIEILSLAPEDYPLQKKRHTDAFLRTIAHLRPRTNKYGAMFRLRAEVCQAIHRFFHDNGFWYIHTPILTGSDCEGAGSLFRVTSLSLENPPRSEGKVDYGQDFFGREANLTVSGQLEAEMMALALGKVYTFGPTFRAENSNTRRHAAEFWMVEPEAAFFELADNMDLGQNLIKHVIAHVMNNCAEDLGLFARFVDQQLMATLEGIARADFEHLAYREAVAIIGRSNHPFEYPVYFGADLQTEHERFLTEVHCKRPVIVYDYPVTLKPFYMRLNDDGDTVAAMDVLVPGIGEIIGGSQREERHDVLEKRMAAQGLDPRDYGWYLESRRFGTVPHSGFGLGLERLLMLVTGVTNIRDVIPFPRTPGNIAF